MKKLFLFVIAFVLSVGTSLSEPFDPSAYTDIELIEIRSAINAELERRSRDDSGKLLKAEFYGYEVSITEIASASEPQFNNMEMVIIEVEFKNNNKTPAKFMDVAGIAGYQNGIALHTITLHLDDERKDYKASIKDGASIRFKTGYKLRDTSSPIEFCIGKYLGIVRGTEVIASDFFQLPD